MLLLPRASTPCGPVLTEKGGPRLCSMLVFLTALGWSDFGDADGTPVAQLGASNLERDRSYVRPSSDSV